MIFTSAEQLDLLKSAPEFPSTRYQGSKLKISNWIFDSISNLHFDTVLDAFGGTGSIAYLMKRFGKQVCYNDILKFNWYIGLALIENDNITLSEEDVNFIINRHSDIKYPSFIADTFENIYYTDKENLWLDMVVANINSFENIYKKALAFFALFQSCIIKRPFNLFHRKNLYIRTSEVKRNFGNKTTWDTPFDYHFKKFVSEANNAVFQNGQKNKAINMDAMNIGNHFDLVYIDTPYISNKKLGVDYHHFYHFLEGLTNYNNWHILIDNNNKYKKLQKEYCIWLDSEKIHHAFNELFKKYRDSILVISYRSDGIPSIDELIKILRKYKSNVIEYARKDYQYVLSKNRTKEVILIGT